MKLGDLTQVEFTAWVQTALRKVGIDTVLSGGSCVSVWSDNAYISEDIDLIVDGIAWRTKIRAAMLELGFTEKNRYFVHPESRWFVEFPNGPLTVGEERPKKIVVRKLRSGSLTLLSATDCIKDRLTWWFHGQDRQCLEQAVAVAQANTVDLRELKRWAAGERMAESFRAIETRLTRKRRSRKDSSLPDPEG